MKKYALVIGIGRYDDPEITDLGFAAQDAREVHRCLVETCGFDEARLLVTGGELEPDHVRIVDALANLAPLVCPGDLLLFYFAGHGIQTRTGTHLLTSNSRIRMPELASVSMHVLQDCLSRIESSDRVLILDACRNDPHKGMGDQDNLLTEGFSRDVLAVAGTAAEGQVPATCVLFSCSEGERAYEWPDQGHGAFTHYLLEGMRGGAVDDRGCLTVQGLGRYVEQRVPRWAQKARAPRPQQPWAQQLGSFREIVLAEALPDRPVPVPRSRPEARVKCPLCGMRNDPDETFECRLCKRDYLCRRHFVEAHACCMDCAKKLAAEQEQTMAEHKRQTAEAAERRHSPSQVVVFPMSADQARQVQVASATALGISVPWALDCGRGVKLELVWIPPGEFLMGSPEDEEGRSRAEKQHRVRLTQGFYIGKYPVTQAQYEAVVGQNPSRFRGKDRSVEVSWNDAVGFCEQLSRRVGHRVRLPTEAQWEYACRAGTATPFSFGATISTDQANYDGNYIYGSGIKGKYRKETMPVGQFPSNAWGLHDMHGNVWEWCADWYGDGYYSNNPDKNPGGPISGVYRVLRGGSWFNGPGLCRSASRYGESPDDTCGNVGFRVVYSSSED
jgi:formylglycine-generating enzyme required for sulfatase activity